MKKHYRLRLALVTLPLAAGLAGMNATAAQEAVEYPSRPISLIVPAAPGGTTDLAARMLAEPLGQAIGQPVVVENRSGASGAIAAVAVKRARPDGYTLLMQYSGYHVITPNVMTQPMQWDATDFRAVANVLSAPQLVVVRDSLPVKTMAELIAHAKADPGALSYGSSGNGSLQHATGAMLMQQTGIEMAHVPYKGTGPTLQDLLAGQIDLTFGTPPPFMPFIESGKLRALAVTGQTRLPSLPDVPTAAEAGLPDLDASSWFGVFAPAATPQAVIDKLAKAIAEVVQDPEFAQKAAAQGAVADYMGPREFDEYTRAEFARWRDVVKASNIQVD